MVRYKFAWYNFSMKSYRFRFYPTPAQLRQLAVDFGVARWAWNTALDARSFSYRALGRSENYVSLNKAFTVLKADPDYAWLKDANSAVITQTLIDQDKAFRNFFEGRAAYPSFKRRRSAQSVRYTLDQRLVAQNFTPGVLLKLPKMGALKVRWSRVVEGTPKMVTVSRDAAGRHFASFSCEVEVKPLPTIAKAVGIDLGLTSIATMSDGFKSGAPRFIRRYTRQLKLAQRVLARRVKGSGRWEVARQRVARIQAKIADCRRDWLHKLSTMIVRTCGVIAMEDLNIKAMGRALRLGKSVADASLGEFVRQIEYKAAWYGREVLKIGRFERSTGVCPDCGLIGPKLPLNVRAWRCECGAEHDRDIAAAKVILFQAVSGTARGAAYQPEAAIS